MDKETQVVISVDGAEAFAEFQRITQAALRAGDSIEDAFAKGAQAMDKMATSGERASTRQVRASQRYEQQLQRQNTLIQAGGQRNADFYELEAKRRGLLTDAVKRQIDAMRQLEAQSKKTNAASGGMSDKQYAAAMRNLPAQMTDITVGLATGQSPFMVLMQQGGQLKDMFGGIGPAAQAVGGSVLRFLTNPMLLAAGAVGGVTLAMYKGRQEQRQFQTMMAMTGNAIGLTTGQVEDMISVMDSSNRAYAANREALSTLISNGLATSETVGVIADAMVAMSRSTGLSMQDLAKDVEALSRDPAKAILDFKGKYETLTGSVYLQVRALQEQGRGHEAVTLAIREQARAMEDLGKKAEENMGSLDRTIRHWKDNFAEVAEFFKGIGRQQADSQLLAEQRIKLEALQQQLTSKTTIRSQLPDIRRQIDETRAEINRIMDRMEDAQEQARKSERAKQGMPALASIEDRYQASLSRSTQLTNELTKATNEYNTARYALLDDAPKLAELDSKFRTLRSKMLADIAKAKADEAKAAKEVGGKAQQYLAQLEKQRNLPAGLLDATWYMESRRGKNMGPSTAGALGHFQFMPDTARQYGIRGKEYDFKASADAAARMFADLLKMTGGSVEKALAGYNWGIGNVQKKGMGAMPAETRNYVATGMRMMRSGKQGSDDIPGGYSNQATAAERYAMQHERTMLALREQRRAVEQGITETQQEYLRLIGSEEYQNMSDAERRSAEAKAREADAEREAVNATRERTEAQKRFAEAVAQSSAAMHELLRAESDRYMRELQGMGKGGQWRDRNAAVNQINDRYQAERERYRGELRTGKITQGEFDAWIVEVDAANQKALQMDAQHWHDKLALQADWRIGAGDALADYAAQVADVASSTSQLFANSFKGAEDALTEFVRTGKLDFSSLIDSFIADSARLAIQQGITGPLAQMMRGWLGGSFALGGYTGHGGRYEPAGIVHKGEGVLNQDEIRAIGGPAGFNSLRRSIGAARGFADGGYAGPVAGIAGGRVPREPGTRVQVNVINQTGAHVETRERTDESGMPVIDVLLTQLDRRMAAGIRSGNSQSGQAMQSTFGLRRRGQ